MSVTSAARLTDVRKSGELWWLRPDGKTQVTIEQEPQGAPTVSRLAGSLTFNGSNGKVCGQRRWLCGTTEDSYGGHLHTACWAVQGGSNQGATSLAFFLFWPNGSQNCQECAGYKGPEMTAPSMADMNKDSLTRLQAFPLIVKSSPSFGKSDSYKPLH